MINTEIELKIKELVKCYLQKNYNLEKTRKINNELAPQLTLDEFKIMHYCIRAALDAQIDNFLIESSQNRSQRPPKS